MKEYTIENAHIFYEYIILTVDGREVFFDPKDLIGLKVNGKIVKKRTRTWLEKCQ